MMTVFEQRNNPLHGLTLALIMAALLDHYGWDGLAEQIPVNCFCHDPSMKSSLKFLRKTPWARDKVERLYLSMRLAEAHKSKLGNNHVEINQ